MIFPSTHKRGTHTSLDIIIAHTSTPSFFSIFLAKCQIKCFCWKCFYHYTIDPTRDLRQKMSELRRIFPCSRKANHVFHPRHDISQLAAKTCRKSIKPANRFAQDWIPLHLISPRVCGVFWIADVERCVGAVPWIWVEASKRIFL